MVERGTRQRPHSHCWSGFAGWRFIFRFCRCTRWPQKQRQRTGGGFDLIIACQFYTATGSINNRIWLVGDDWWTKLAVTGRSDRVESGCSARCPLPLTQTYLQCFLGSVWLDVRCILLFNSSHNENYKHTEAVAYLWKRLSENDLQRHEVANRSSWPKAGC